MPSTSGVGADRDASGKWLSLGGLRATGARASLTQSEPYQGSLGALWLGFWALTAMARVPSLVGEPRFHKAHSQEKKKSSEYFFSCLLAFFTRKEGLENELAFCMIRQRRMRMILTDLCSH